ncbi:myelin transcription factor 1-like protein, partial [Homalodisca vitripennis]|uniref:myelin transcription factor 1-like protein n=1 Tax=Homalodisca vitripennis TaxID=197043 RepID=UPI001EEBA6E0
MPPAKRGRTGPVMEGGECLLRADGLEVEYQVPTSSQRDQEDDVILVDSEEEEEEDDDEGLPDDGGLDDGKSSKKKPDNEEVYEMEVYSRDDPEIANYDIGEGPDIDENITNQDNNEVEII